MIDPAAVGQRELLVVAQQIAPAPARHEAAEARLALDQRLEEGSVGVEAPKPSTSSDTSTPRAGAAHQSVAHAPAGLVVVPDIIEDAQRFLGAVDQGDQRLEPLAARRAAGSAGCPPPPSAGSARLRRPRSSDARSRDAGEAETRRGRRRRSVPLGMAPVPVSRLSLSDFRSYADAVVAPGPGFVILTGENGAGKTNVLEAVSLLVAGPGPARRDAGRDGAARRRRRLRRGGAARRDRHRHRHRRRRAPERRQVRINGAPASANSLSEWLSVLWLTPAMDRLFADAASGRRRFLDRLVLALRPGHADPRRPLRGGDARAQQIARRGRARATRPGSTALEARMAEHGAAIAEARAATVAALGERLAAAPEGPFARAGLAPRRRRRADLAERSPPAAPATPPPAAPWPARTAPTSSSPMSARASRPRSARPASRRRC